MLFPVIVSASLEYFQVAPIAHYLEFVGSNPGYTRNCG